MWSQKINSSILSSLPLEGAQDRPPVSVKTLQWQSNLSLNKLLNRSTSCSKSLHICLVDAFEVACRKRAHTRIRNPQTTQYRLTSHLRNRQVSCKRPHKISAKTVRILLINKLYVDVRANKGLKTPMDNNGLEKRAARFSNPLVPLSQQRKFRSVDKIFLEDQKQARILEFKLVEDE